MGTVKLSVQRRYQLIDKLLDSYNYNMSLYQTLGDYHYKERAELFMDTLKHYFSDKDSY